MYSRFVLLLLLFLLSSCGGSGIAPAVPKNLVATAGERQVLLSWTASTGATGYKVYRGGSLVGTSTIASYTDTTVAATTTYAYAIAAYDAAGNVSAPCAAVSITTSAGVSITAVTGVLQHGATATISGSGFGVKSPVEPYFFDDFEASAPGQAIWGKQGTVGESVWKMLDGGSHADSLYSTEGYRGQGVKRVSSMNDFRDGHIDGINAQQAYVTYRYRYTHTGSWTGSYSSINKIFRMASLEGSNPIYSGQPALMMTYQPVANWLYSLLSTDGTEAGSTNKTIPAIADENTWYRIEGYLKLSSPAGEDNGEYFAGTQNNHGSETAKVTRATGYTSRINSFLLPFTSANGGEAAADTYTQWADDAYFDNTQARVELCDAAQWSSSTKRCEIQIPRVTWVDNSIQIQVNLGAFQSGQTAYLHVIDASGRVNNDGYPVQIP